MTDFESYGEEFLKEMEGRLEQLEELKFSDISTEELKKNVEDVAFTFVQRFSLIFDEFERFWIWNKEKKRYVLIDKVSLLLLLKKVIPPQTYVVTYRPTIKNMLVDALMRLGREKYNEIEKLSPDWIQFGSKIYNWKTGEILPATPDYYIENIIPWEVGLSEDTPTLDKLFKDWLGDQYEILYDILAFSVLREYRWQKIIVLFGRGANGKSSFLNILTKFVGEENVVSSDLYDLFSSRFETSRLYQKLVCKISETGFTKLKNTTKLKELSGNDLVKIEFKGKNTNINKTLYAKIIISTNSLPPTEDKTEGFYRRFVIVEFKRQFREKDKQFKANVLELIPDYEFNNLAKKVLRLLKDLEERNGLFKGELNLEEKQKQYEFLSNPLYVFVKKHLKEKADSKVPVIELYEKFVGFCRKHGFRQLSLKSFSSYLVNEFEFEKKREIDQETYTRRTYILGVEYVEHPEQEELEDKDKDINKKRTISPYLQDQEPNLPEEVIPDTPIDYEPEAVSVKDLDKNWDEDTSSLIKEWDDTFL